MKNTKREIIPKEVEKVTTLEALLSLQSNNNINNNNNNNRNEVITRLNKTAPHLNEISQSQSLRTLEKTDPLSGQTPRNSRKFGSQSLPKMTENSDQLIEEINLLQHALVDKFRSNQKLVSGAQFRSGIKEPIKCEQCEAKDVLLKKTKENVRSLKFQISRLEDRLYNGNKKNEKLDLNLSGQSLEIQTDINEDLKQTNHELMRQLNELEQTNSLLNQLLTKEKQSSEANLEGTMRLLKEKDETIRVLKDELIMFEKNRLNHNDDINKKMNDLKCQLNLKIEYSNDLEEKFLKLTTECEEMKLLLQKYNDSNNQSNIEHLQNEIINLKKLIAENEMNSKLSLRKYEEVKQNQLRLETELKDSSISNSELQQQNGMYKNLLDIANKEMLQLNDNLVLKENQRKTLSDELELARSLLVQRDEELTRLQNNHNNGRSEMDSTINQMNDLIKRLTAESEKSALAIQKAISSSVRLCVVAPTVNVHVADKKMKFRTNVPREALTEFLENQILSKYTFLFDQKIENTGPDGVTEIQPWIKKILGEMQSSIEEHISAAMRSNG